MPSRHAFSYSLPEGMELAAGQFVYVPFGSRTLQGVVMEVAEQPAYAETRDVIGPIGEGPLVSPERTTLAGWLSEYYLAPLFDCVALMLPPGSRRRPLTFYECKSETSDSAQLSDRQRELITYVKSSSLIEQTELKKAKGAGAATVAEQLARRGLLARSYGLDRPRAAPKEALEVRLIASPEEAQAAWEGLGAPKQRALERLREASSMPLPELRSATRIDNKGLAELERLGLIAIERTIVRRDPLAGRDYPLTEALKLTQAQDDAFRQIAAALTAEEQATFLLHGVTGSGKTEVYLQALAETVSRGKRAIVLVPEISLTPQTVRRFAERFPKRVAVMHSGLSLGEQYDQWHTIAQGQYDVVVGARSAIFSPQPDLGLIVIDEEHEWTYKQQDPAPRYHTRRVAQQLVGLAQATLVLGSATPSLDSYTRALNGRYKLLSLPQRVQSGVSTNGHASTTGALPKVTVVSMQDELKAGNYSNFSGALVASLERTLQSSEQAILFVNRRGSASFVQCRSCGYVPRCTSCSVALTYHEAEQALVCHYCHRRRPPLTQCPQCEGQHVREQGIGTQRVEEEVRRLFPKARLLRWDRDVTRGSDSHERILESFVSHEADILIGTQMVAKGLDIPRITLAGVIAADLGLYLPDYNSAERTFQLLSQVAGRAGRGAWPGQVIIQTYSPEHYAIQAAAKHDYQTFYRTESALRRACSYPPFGRLVRLVYAHTNRTHAEEEAERLVKHLRQEQLKQSLSGVQVLGPTSPYVERIRGRFRRQILLKGRNPSALLESLSTPDGWTIDIDPVSLL